MAGQPSMNIIIYHELRKISPEKAREVVRKVYEQNNCNISKTAKILCISTHTVHRAINGPLHDKSRKPKNSPRKALTHLENLIILEAKKKTGFKIQMSGFLFI